jgi:hypothetical protein
MGPIVEFSRKPARVPFGVLFRLNQSRGEAHKPEFARARRFASPDGEMVHPCIVDSDRVRQAAFCCKAICCSRVLGCKMLIWKGLGCPQPRFTRPGSRILFRGFMSLGVFC